METQTKAAKAKAQTATILDADAQTLAQVATATANLATVREAAIAEFESLGREAGRGAGSLTIAAMRFSRLVADGTMSVGEGKAAKGDDAELTYLKFVEGYNAIADAGTDKLATDAKTPISTFRTFGKAARFHRGDVAYFSRVLETHATCAKDERVSAYNALVSANRKLVEASEASEFKGSSPAAVFANVATDPWVMERCLKKPVDPKTAKDKIADLIAKLDKCGESLEYAGLGDPLAAMHAWFDKWVAGGCKSELETSELLKAAAVGNA